MRLEPRPLMIDEVRAVELTSVRKSYGGLVALDNLSLAIPRGCIYGSLGPNGAGKTTALRMMVGILMPDEGTVQVFGQAFARRHLKTIGYLPEERGLYRKAKVGELLRFLGELKGLPRAITERRI